MTKSKSSASSIVVLSRFCNTLVNSAQLLNATCVAWCPVIEILPFTK